MDETEPVAHLGLPLALSAAGGAAVLASMTRWWFMGFWHGPVAVVVATTIGGWIGTALTHSLRCDPPAVTARKTFAFIAFAAPITALLVSLFCGANEWGGDAMLLGALFGMVLLPGALLATRLARRAQRSRERSLVGGSDRRAAWRATAVWLAVASLIGSAPAVCDRAALFWWSTADKAELAVGPLVVALIACVVAALVALLDWRAERIVVRANDASHEWRVDVAGDSAVGLDVGIGFAAWMEHVGGRATYRDSLRERVVAVGDLLSGAALLQNATRRSAIALAFVGAAEVATLYFYAMLTGAR